MPETNIKEENKYYSKELIQKAQEGEDEALKTLVAQNQPLVISIAKRYYYLSESMEDLIQIGNIGLIKAIKKFDFGYETQFSTYAVYLIGGEIKKYFRDNSYLKTGRDIKSTYIKIKSFSENYLKLNGCAPSLSEIGESLELTINSITAALEACSAPEYLQSPIAVSDRGTKTLGEMIHDKNEAYENAIDLTDLKNVVSSLPKEERQLIVLRYFKNMTQAQTGAMLKKSQVQISRMEKKIMAKLKTKLT